MDIARVGSEDPEEADVEHRRTSDTTVEEKPEHGLGTRGNGKPAEQHEEGAIIAGIRATDIEPYTGLRYLSKLFRFMAIILLLLLVAEIATGLYAQGAASIPTLLGDEKKANVFLRADEPSLAARLQMKGRSAAEVFGELRERKNRS